MTTILRARSLQEWRLFCHPLLLCPLEMELSKSLILPFWDGKWVWHSKRQQWPLEWAPPSTPRWVRCSIQMEGCFQETKTVLCHGRALISHKQSSSIRLAMKPQEPWGHSCFSVNICCETRFAFWRKINWHKIRKNENFSTRPFHSLWTTHGIGF